ncbi:hypothetical protein J8F10_23075 [Gemmata sp. G18]|uniref:Uncharacterized protein n=1 Tax=Gemmata palustris TaxID=2822762 RepID=A0ABS5BWN4_9BACT|nr:hypothetical protein [Gemmata palustris]MBP3958142.1 hypothetical protein [Gemmata palustris]
MPIVADRIMIDTPIVLQLGPIMELANLTQIRDIAAYTVLNVFEKLEIRYDHICLAIGPTGAVLMIE